MNSFDENIIKELSFKATRSSGAGGQHVNKVSSKVALTFDIDNSLVLTDEQKQALINKLSSRLTKDHVLILYCDESRSQHKNKEIAIARFLETIIKGLRKPKIRKPTKIKRSAIENRLEKKKKQAYKKVLRTKPKFD